MRLLKRSRAERIQSAGQYHQLWYTANMTKIEQLAHTAANLSDEQVDGLIAFATYLAGEPLYNSAPPEVLASIDRGLAQLERGDTIAADTVFADLQRKIDAARS